MSSAEYLIIGILWLIYAKTEDNRLLSMGGLFLAAISFFSALLSI